MTKPSIYLFRYHGNEHMDPHFSVCFLTWYGISFKKNLGSLNYYGPKKSSVNVASILKPDIPGIFIVEEQSVLTWTKLRVRHRHTLSWHLMTVYCKIDGGQSGAWWDFMYFDKIVCTVFRLPQAVKCPSDIIRRFLISFEDSGKWRIRILRQAIRTQMRH